MTSHALYFLLLLHVFPTTITTAADQPAHTATDLILLNCGASSNSNDTSGRSWDGDERSRYAPSNAATISITSSVSFMDPSVFSIPYQTARIFHSPFTYTFPVSAGPKFLRLYFHPNVYSDLNTSRSFFSVTTNRFTLLSNFSAFLHSLNPSQPSFMKEFVINMEENQRLALTFSPNTDSFAFINGIEIVSMPDTLYFPGNDDAPIKFVDQLYYLDNKTALENLYRLNVGGSHVDIKDDSGPNRGMFRAWSNDNDFIFGQDFGFTPSVKDLTIIKYTAETPPYSAPPIVYATSRMMANYSISLEWEFPVDSGFYYLLRFHFCEYMLEVTKEGMRVFTISINNETAEIEADVFFWTGGMGIPIFRDYVTWVADDGRRGKQNLRLSLKPNRIHNPSLKNAFLNGLEIFKLSDSDRSLAAANPDAVVNPSPPKGPVNPRPKNKSRGATFYAVIGSVTGVLAVVAAVAFLILRWRRKVKDSATSVTTSSWVPLSTGSKSTARTSRSGVSLPSDLCRYFSIDEIKTATRNFDDNFVIGRGGFGNVYKGLIDNAAATVAIKRLNPSSNQGAREFLTEIEMLSKLRHLHLVSLIGYCDDDREMILVYDYMAHGTLNDHIYNSHNTLLPWKQRLQICLGAAKGLDYLHTGAKHAIIHRDVKSTNILLDDKWVAKVSDFGLSKVGPAAGGQTHVSTVVKGSFGYVDPEYYRRQQLTLKSDVYSFGVVLFEVLCARPAIITTLPREQVNLAEWAKFCYRKGTLDQIIDSNLKDQIAPECLSSYAETAVACLREKGIDRPSMNDIVWKLEFAMQLQISAESRGGDGTAACGDSDGFVAMNPSLPLLGIGVPNTTDEDTFSRSRSNDFSTSTSSSEKLKSGDAFSEIINPLAR